MAADRNERDFLPALRFRSLTPAFDSVVRVTSRERHVKEALLDAAAVTGGEHVLDLGAGTGTLALMLKRRSPEARVTGLDADPEVLALARGKARDAGVEVELVEGRSTDLPFEDGSLDVVVSTLFFHHLTTADKRRTAAEVARVLRPGGRLHVADWGRPADLLMALLFLGIRAFDGFEVTRANARGELPAIFAAAGLSDVREDLQMRSPLGTIALYSARRAR